jgi:hypothetical protein
VNYLRSRTGLGDLVPYADSDFFLALMKEDDWLKPKALAMHRKHKGQIWTSPWAVVELLLVAREYGLDTQRLVGDVFQLAEVRGATLDFFANVASLLDEGLTVFDALHATSCGDDQILSSDRRYEKVGLRRLALER